MSFLLVNTTNEKAVDQLRKWVRGHKRSYVKDKEWMIRKFGSGTYLLDANGATLALLLDLRKRYNGDVDIYAVQPLHENEFPKKVRKEVIKCIDKNTSRKHSNQHFFIDFG